MTGDLPVERLCFKEDILWDYSEVVITAAEIGGSGFL